MLFVWMKYGIYSVFHTYFQLPPHISTGYYEYGDMFKKDLLNKQ